MQLPHAKMSRKVSTRVRSSDLEKVSPFKQEILGKRTERPDYDIEQLCGWVQRHHVQVNVPTLERALILWDWEVEVEEWTEHTIDIVTNKDYESAVIETEIFNRLPDFEELAVSSGLELGRLLRCCSQLIRISTTLFDNRGIIDNGTITRLINGILQLVEGFTSQLDSIYKKTRIAWPHDAFRANREILGSMISKLNSSQNSVSTILPPAPGSSPSNHSFPVPLSSTNVVDDIIERLGGWSVAITDLCQLVEKQLCTDQRTCDGTHFATTFLSRMPTKCPATMEEQLVMTVFAETIRKVARHADTAGSSSYFYVLMVYMFHISQSPQMSWVQYYLPIGYIAAGLNRMHEAHFGRKVEKPGSEEQKQKNPLLRGSLSNSILLRTVRQSLPQDDDLRSYSFAKSYLQESKPTTSKGGNTTLSGKIICQEESRRSCLIAIEIAPPSEKAWLTYDVLEPKGIFAINTKERLQARLALRQKHFGRDYAE